MRGLGGCGIHRNRPVNRLNAGIALVSTDYCIHGIENRYVNDGHRATRATGPELFAEDTILAWCNRRVIQAGGVDCDFVPPADRVEPLLWAGRRNYATGVE